MGRPLRVEYRGALYHITSRGNERMAVFLIWFSAIAGLEIWRWEDCWEGFTTPQ
jgi:hypothetical protein